MQSKLIGILAGMGPRSTAPFIDLVISECQRQYGAVNDIDFPPMMIYSLPAPFYVDRPLDHAALEAAISAGLQQLAQTGAALIAMPCNTAHIYYPQLTHCIQAPLLNMIDLTLQKVPPTTRRLALLATRPTVEANLYQAAIQARGVAVVSQEDWQQRVDALIKAIKTSQASDQSQAMWRELMQTYKAAAIDTVLIACTDLNAIRLSDTGNMTIVDATHCLAAAVVAQWRALT